MARYVINTLNRKSKINREIYGHFQNTSEDAFTEEFMSARIPQFQTPME